MEGRTVLAANKKERRIGNLDISMVTTENGLSGVTLSELRKLVGEAKPHINMRNIRGLLKKDLTKVSLKNGHGAIQGIVLIKDLYSVLEHYSKYSNLAKKNLNKLKGNN